MRKNFERCPASVIVPSSISILSSVSCILYSFLLLSCSHLPGASSPLRLGPLHFGMTVAEMEKAFPDKDRELDAYDTPLGQSWTIVKPFGDNPPAPDWLTADVDRAALSFWNDRLYRVRLHLTTNNLSRALELKKRFDRGYRLESNLSQSERLFLEYRTADMQVFLSGGGDQNVAAAFVDRRAYEAMDASRQRMRQKAAESFSVEGLRFGMKRPEAQAALGGKSEDSDFFAGLESRAWREPARKIEMILGFSPDLGLAAIPRLSTERWMPRRVQEKIWELTRAFGQGKVKAARDGRILTIDAGAIRVSLIVADCNEAGCMVSEGWLWEGPEIKEQ